MGLSLREAAGRIGISAAYLVSIEQGHNPSTGRAPMPSMPVLIAIGRTYAIDVRSLLGPVLEPDEGHALLIQLGDADGPVPVGALRLIAPNVDEWLDVAARRVGSGSSPQAALEELAPLVAHTSARTNLGLIFGAGRNVMGETDDPSAVIASEATWHRDVAAVCREAAGVDPAVNVCVYRSDELRTIGHIDPLHAGIDLIRAHPRVLAQTPSGDLVDGLDAITAILGALRQDTVRDEAWDALASAAAAGLNRQPVM